MPIKKAFVIDFIAWKAQKPVNYDTILLCKSVTQASKGIHRRDWNQSFQRHFRLSKLIQAYATDAEPQSGEVDTSQASCRANANTGGAKPLHAFATPPSYAQ